MVTSQSGSCIGRPGGEESPASLLHHAIRSSSSSTSISSTSRRVSIIVQHPSDIFQEYPAG